MSFPHVLPSFLPSFVHVLPSAGSPLATTAAPKPTPNYAEKKAKLAERARVKQDLKTLLQRVHTAFMKCGKDDIPNYISIRNGLEKEFGRILVEGEKELVRAALEHLYRERKARKRWNIPTD
jgi:hypothetical protein